MQIISILKKGNIFLLRCKFIFSICNFSTIYSIGYLEGTVVQPVDFGKPQALGEEPRKEAPQGKQWEGGLRTFRPKCSVNSVSLVSSGTFPLTHGCLPSRYRTSPESAWVNIPAEANGKSNSWVSLVMLTPWQPLTVWPFFLWMSSFHELL